MLNAVFPGREHAMFFGPPVDLSSEAWRLLGYWDVKRQEDGTVIVEHPDIELWASERPDDYRTHLSGLVMELPAFEKEVTMAHQELVIEYGGRIGANASLPALVTDANRLRDYYTEVGAYASHAPTPAQPPPPYPKADIGKKYSAVIFANCAFFDGRFWIADPPLYDDNGNLLQQEDNPITEGAMELVREDLVAFKAASGQTAEFVPFPPDAELDDDACSWP